MSNLLVGLIPSVAWSLVTRDRRVVFPDLFSYLFLLFEYIVCLFDVKKEIMKTKTNY